MGEWVGGSHPCRFIDARTHVFNQATIIMQRVFGVLKEVVHNDAGVDAGVQLTATCMYHNAFYAVLPWV